jgi:hypothetical protein
MKRIERLTVDLSGYPDLVVIYLGMRINRLAGMRTLLRFGRRIDRAVAAKPEGLLLHEPIIYSLLPPHVGMRQYWRDFESLETWARSLPHQQWWKEFLGNPGGTGFWHETYFMKGGMEAIYDDVPVPLGFSRFAPAARAEGSMFGARSRLGLRDEAKLPPAVPEDQTGPEEGLLAD